MFKFFVVVLFALFGAAWGALVTPVAYSAPLVAPGVVTATSSQYFARNYNGLAAAPLIAAPVAAQYTAHYAAPVAYSAPLVSAYTAPVVTAAKPLKYTAAAPILI